MIAQCLYQSDPKNLASMGRQRLACQRAARKLQWGVQKERISETNEPVPLLMRPAVKEILQDAEQHRFDVLLIGNRDSLCCDAADIAENFSRDARGGMEVLRVLVTDREENHADSVTHIGLAAAAVTATF